MESSYFYFLILPLAIFVFALASLVFYYAKREEFAHKKLKKLADKQEETFTNQLDKLNELRKNKSIDRITYDRLKRILETDIRQKRKEAQEQLSSLADENKPPTQR